MQMRHRLSRLRAVLHCDREASLADISRRWEISSGHKLLGQLYRCEEVCYLRRGKICEAAVWPKGADENVAGDQRLEIDNTERVDSLEKDLAIVRSGKEVIIPTHLLGNIEWPEFNLFILCGSHDASHNPTCSKCCRHSKSRCKHN